VGRPDHGSMAAFGFTPRLKGSSIDWQVGLV